MVPLGNPDPQFFNDTNIVKVHKKVEVNFIFLFSNFNPFIFSCGLTTFLFMRCDDVRKHVFTLDDCEKRATKRDDKNAMDSGIVKQNCDTIERDAQQCLCTSSTRSYFSGLFLEHVQIKFYIHRQTF